MISPVALITLQVEALFTHDRAGRIVRTNEPDGTLAPRFFLGRTREGHVARVRYDIPADLADQLTALATGEPLDADLQQAPLCAALVRALLGETARADGDPSGPAFRFPDRVDAADGVVIVHESDAPLVARLGLTEGELHERRPCYAVVRDGIGVSTCFSARRSGRVAEAGVSTLPAYRGRGYAAGVVAAWARAVRDEGLIPLYSTSWDNLASRGVARHLGLIQYGADWSLP